MNPHKLKLKLVSAFAALLFCFAIGSAPAGAADRFLAAPVPVQPEPELGSPSGAFDFVEAESGEAVAVWGESDGLWTSVRLPGGTFQAPVKAVAGVQASANPELAITPSGYTVMTWRDSSQVMRAVRQPGAPNFGPELQVSDEDFQIPNIDPQVAIADDGLTILTWKGRDIEGDENSTRIRKRFLTPEGDLNGAISNVSPVSATGVTSPDVFSGPTGFSLVTWVVGDTITGDPATCWMEAGGGAPDIQVFDVNSGWAPVGAVDADGNAVIAHKVGGDVIGNSRPTGVGQNFLVDQGLDLPGTNGYTPQVSMDETGRTTVAFEYYVGPDEGIQTVERPAGSSQLFGTTTKLFAGEIDEANSMRLAVGAGGLALIGYATADDRVHAVAREAGATQFGEPTGPIGAAAEAGDTAVGAAGDGTGIVVYSALDIPSDDYTLSALPYDDVPVANGLSIPATVEQGKPVGFSVDPVDPWAAVTGVEWELEAGVTKSGAQISHTYATPGQRTVKLTLTDSLGNETKAEGSIDVTAAPVPPPDTTAPKLTAVSMLKKKSKRGAKNAFRFTLSERARVEIQVKRVSKGKGKRAQGRIVRQNVAPGKRRVVFNGRVNRRKLKPARYRATIVAVDAAGNRSKPRKLTFRIMR